MYTTLYLNQIQRLITLFIMLILSVTPVPATAFPLNFDVEILLLFAGPVSEAVQETVLLVRRGDNFITKESLSIGCVAGASSGFLVGMAPVLGFIEVTTGSPPGAFHVVGTMLLSCVMSIASGVTGMGTAWALQELRQWREHSFIRK